jgi:hypothetical protein
MSWNLSVENVNLKRGSIKKREKRKRERDGGRRKLNVG